MPQHAISSAESAAQAAGGGATAIGLAATIWAGLSAAADALFGVPLSVVFAAATASFGALTYLGQVSTGRLIAASFFYTAIGAFTVPLAMHLMGAPQQASAGVGAVISGALPFMMPKIRERLPQVIDFLFDKLTGRGGPK